MSENRYQTGCRHFSGYKPCNKSKTCDDLCTFKDIPATRVLLVHLGAIGAVVRSTALLTAIKEKYRSSHITWITQKPCNQLLANHPLVDLVLTTSSEDMMQASNFEYDLAICVDKSLVATGIVKQMNCKKVVGFTADPRGGIVPANFKAKDLWELGLDNHKKFMVNKKPETQLMHEAFELPYSRGEYNLPLLGKEKEIANLKSNTWRLHPDDKLIGINTGCSAVIPYKKLPYESYVSLIKRLQESKNLVPVLLGGPEDQVRNERLHLETGAIYSPCDKGLRDGLTSVAACDVVVTGDSLGMHMAISQKKWVVAWFGPTCAHEIDLYERGRKIITNASCSPCWKRQCNMPTMCYDLVSLDDIYGAILEGLGFELKTNPKADISK
ncbi:MAG: glycosyltransferase family 9 protein [Bdellovibrionales bacterium]|nr:glycosyltransferase family 9 protein [Bdellovibrionales bacterium]